MIYAENSTFTRQAPILIFDEATQSESWGGQKVHTDPEDHLIMFNPVLTDWIKNDFEKHEKKWKQETQFMSSPSEKYLHPSYARIIGLGWPAVSMILHSLEKEPADWFYALRAITGANPVTDSMAGDVRKMSKAWIKWGKKSGLL